MTYASKTTFCLINLKILRPKVTENLMNLHKKFCEFLHLNLRNLFDPTHEFRHTLSTAYTNNNKWGSNMNGPKVRKIAHFIYGRTKVF